MEISRIKAEETVENIENSRQIRFMITGKYSIIFASGLTTLLKQLTVQRFYMELDKTRVFVLRVL
jgi:hypothetical protein